jgi:para-nitrobenzyl esterase
MNSPEKHSAPNPPANRDRQSSKATFSKAPFSRERRALLGGMALAGAGLAASALTPANAAAEPAATKTAAATGCGPSKVLASDKATVAETASGKIRGYKRNGVYIFKGVPYGASTAGSNRFMPPAKPEPWTGIRNALQYGPVCPSADSGRYGDEDVFLLHRCSAAEVQGEDCLRLNLWTPEISSSQSNTSRKRPVMVYMHGGGFSVGCGHDLLSYEGESLARNHDVVVINHNHRLNVYGYLNLAGIGGDSFAASANAGLLDLVAVLEWTRDHVATFGGDPDNVTIFGQSGGGQKVISLMAMPAAKGLFHRAIVQSGPYLKSLSPDYSNQVAELLLAELSLSKSQLSDLQQIPIDRLTAAAVAAMKKMPRVAASPRGSFAVNGWGPTVDGHTLPHHPFDPGAPAISANIPLITGTNFHEGVSAIDHPDADAMSEEEMKQGVAKTFGSDSDAIIAAYRQEYPKATPFGIYGAIFATPFRYPSVEQAKRKAAQGAAPAYSYLYSWRTPSLDNRPGSFHACEISFAFDNAEICDHYSAGSSEAFTLSKQMSTAWTSFARTGNPNHEGMPHWPPYTVDTRSTMCFDTTCTIRNDPEGKGLQLITKS